MRISLDRNSKIPLTDQIVLELTNRIETGVLRPGQKLLSVRKMSAQLNVSPMTVVKAYERLEKSGLIEKTHGKGTFVAHVEWEHAEAHLSADEPEAEDWQEQVEDYVTISGYVQRSLMGRHLGGTTLALAALHARFLPTKEILSKFNDRVRGHEAELAPYPPVEGDPGLISAVVEYMDDRGVHIHEREVLITNGTQLAINLVAQTFIGHGDVVVVESPTYPGAVDVFKSRGAIVVEVPIEESGIRTDLLYDVCESYDVKLLYTMPRYQNPTGYSMDYDTSMEVLDMAEEFGFLILEDDSWGELSYERAERPLKAMDKTGRVLYASGFSKVYGPSMRISALIAGGVLHAKLLSVKSNLDSGAPLINQYMLAPYLNSLEEKQHLTWLRHELRALRDRVDGYLRQSMPSIVKWVKPRGGLVFWLTLPCDFDVQMLYYRSMAEADVSFLLGRNCYASKKGSNQMRICFTYVEEDAVKTGIFRLGELVQEVAVMCRASLQAPML